MTTRWAIITIGNLSRNRYWGEADDAPRRPALCTTTLVTLDAFRLIVDPSIEDPVKMAAELDRRAGITPAAVDVVFITHEHGDHHAGLAAFASARWTAAAPVAEAINRTGRYAKPVDGVAGEAAPGIDIISTPGHTPAHHSLSCTDSDGMRVVIAGDAVMTKDFWEERRGFFNSADTKTMSATMKRLATMADIIVPGHDNYFLTRPGNRIPAGPS